jgi:hypothetical protein
MGVNSKRKGIRGELEACAALKSLGLQARRAQQYQGLGSAGDVIIDGAPEVHVEVKSLAFIAVYNYLEQATRDSRGRKVEMALCKANRKPWFVACYVEQLPALIRHLQEAGLVSSKPEAEEGDLPCPEPAGDAGEAGLPEPTMEGPQ